VGLAQIMGFHANSLAYESAQAMWEEMSAGIAPQIEGMFRFIVARPAAIDALRRQDFVTFARYYNGNGQKERYGKMIKTATEVYREVTRERLHK